MLRPAQERRLVPSSQSRSSCLLLLSGAGARVEDGDRRTPARAQAVCVPTGGGCTGLVSALEEIEQRSARVAGVPDLLVGKEGEMAARPGWLPARRLGTERPFSEAGGLRRRVRVEGGHADLLVAGPEAEADHLV